MVRNGTRFFCKECGYESVKWLGKCPGCGAWNAFVEEKITTAKGQSRPLLPAQEAISLTEVQQQENPRLATGIRELDRVLGGGLVAGSLILLGGDPGIGKSTLLLQMAGNLARTGQKVLYLSGEESVSQLRLRSLRLEINEANIFVLNDPDLDHLEATLNRVNPELAIVDSIQTVFLSSAEGAQGSVTQLKECTARLMALAKSSGRVFFLIGHVTKEGALAGPRMLEHMVDVVAYFEGERNYHYRILRGVKNRFGSTDEIGVFEMSAKGLLEVEDPAVIFLQQRGSDSGIAGSAVAVSFEGTRPLLIEVQALVASTGAYTRRMAMGIDQNRLALIIAILEKKCGFHLNNSDIYLKISGGLFLRDPSVDLGVAAAILSSHQDKPWPPQMAFVGEMALSGEIRPIPFIEARIKEAQKLGFTSLVLPRGLKEREKRVARGIKLLEVRDIYDLYQIFLQG